MQKWPARSTGLLLASFLIASCVRSAPGPKAASGTNAGGKPPVAVQAPGQQPAAQQKQPVAQQPAAKPLALTKETAPAGGAVVVKRDRGLLALYSLEPKRTSTPEDFRIGPLAGAGSAGLSAEDAETLRTAAALLSELSESRVAADLLFPDRKDALARVLTEAIGEGQVPLRFRLGPVTRTEDGGPRVNVRLFGSKGSADGELFFGKKDARWLVSDIQVRFESMAQERQPGEEKYFPSSYQWLLDDF